MTDNKLNSGNTGNYNDSQPYVVGILSPSTTLYIDQPPDNRSVLPPTDLNLRRRNTNSFQITSVTVQGSRRNEDFADDSADDLDESHTDDLSSDFLDSSRADNEGYHSEDNSNPICDDLSPCGPIIFAHVPNNIRDPNMNLSLGVTPTFTAMGPNIVAGGVTMMTSKSESPISAQVPIMNPLPDNWQRRFKVVKIISSEPFKRGRWLCMDFKDPPAVQGDIKSDNDKNNIPSIQITNCGVEAPPNEQLNCDNMAQVYELPINQTYSGNYVMGNQQQMYGIILPQNNQIQPVTLVQDMSIQTTVMDRNFNHIVDKQSILIDGQQQNMHSDIGYTQNSVTPSNFSRDAQQHPVPLIIPEPSQSANNLNSSDAVLSQVANSVINNRDVALMQSRMRHNSESDFHMQEKIEATNLRNIQSGDKESFSCLDNKLSRASGLHPRGLPPSAYAASVVTNGRCRSPMPQMKNPVKIVPTPQFCPPPAVAKIVVDHTVVEPPTLIGSENSSSQTAPEKVPEVGSDVDPPAGSAASTGANTVAIDNKIEQAMDLVKSHLMFAVREEVEVLKEKISELLDRISQLEHENDILRANASAETLKQLNNQSHKKIVGGGAKQQSVAPVAPPST